MREIKFRGKRELSGKWYVGDFSTDTSEFNRTCDKAYISPHWDKLNSQIRVVKETVGQYIGLKDKNGREIYEGDVSEASDGEIRIICYDSNQAKYKAVPLHCYKQYAGQGGWTGYELRNDNRHEVIGNIYEDTHLLEEPK